MQTVTLCFTYLDMYKKNHVFLHVFILLNTQIITIGVLRGVLHIYQNC